MGTKLRQIYKCNRIIADDISHFHTYKSIWITCWGAGEGAGRELVACCQAPQVVVYQRLLQELWLPSNWVLNHGVFLVKVFTIFRVITSVEYLDITSKLLAYASWLRAILHPSNFVQLCSQSLISLPGKTAGWFGISKHHFSSCGLTSKSYLMSIMWFEGRFRSLGISNLDSVWSS